MEFSELLKDTDCQCLENANQDNVSIFAKKINKPNPTDKDFKSHWERGKTSIVCDEICGYKGLSVNLWNESTKEAVIKKYVTTFGISPKHKDSIFVFKFLDEAGMVKYTPNENDKSHYDFYKSDNFTLEMLEQTTEIIPLNQFI